jgi:hypothetical protein
VFPRELHIEKLGVIHHLTFENDAVAELIVSYSITGLVLLYLGLDWLRWLLG